MINKINNEKLGVIFAVFSYQLLLRLFNFLNNAFIASNGDKKFENLPLTQPTLLELEIYKQAHETRRRWEHYIWQWGIIITALLTLAPMIFTLKSLSGFISSPPQNMPYDIEFLRKVTLVLLSTFLLSVALNVYRARILMKLLEKTIIEFHEKYNKAEFPVIPSQLDK